ncbi:EAL domain-containing protein [Bradyrhizobium sp. ARR65]|uniref:bifunctional diguanylate cyclase/phosphodiesterase n=1 Tax=Bradyrhizobium sp. ARR65 TaxID=1040989 RepID=UPI000467A579|nr:EAL domain-containing protein [Bradyrhizobium sp. ARR65]
MRDVISSIWARMSRGLASRLRRVRREPVFWLTLCGGALVIAIFVGTIVTIDGFRERAIANSARELQNTVMLLTRHFDQQFADSETVADELIAQMQISGATSPEIFRERMSTSDAHLMLRSKVSALSYIGDVAVYDADGKMINWSRPDPVPDINVAKRNYFKILKSDPPAEPIVIEAVRSYFDGGWTTIIAHRLTGPGGIFLGVMSRRIDPANYERFFASLALGEGAAIAMFSRDGTMLARHPHVDALIGRRLAKAPLLQKIISLGGQQTLRMQSPIDGQDRLGTGAQVGHFPIVVVATKTAATALADWREQTRFLVMAAALSAAIIALILFAIIRQIRRQNREAQRKLEAERQRLDTALNNMTQGLVLYDASAHIVTFNQRYIDMYKLSREVVKPGLHYYDLIQHRKDTGSFDGDVRAFCDPIMRDVAQGKVSRRIMEIADGRSFEIVNKPLAQGGWVATIEDISDRRRLEQERDRNYTFLREIIDHIPSQITVKDAQSRRYLLVNSVAEYQFDMTREEIVGKTAYDVFSEKQADIVTADDDETLQSAEGFFRDEHPWDTLMSGRRWITSKRIGLRDSAGKPRYIINVVDDVTVRREADEKIAHLAHYDALTDLPNRVLFRERIERELKRAQSGQKFALLYIDIDEFKGINDSLGHHVGDELLKAVAARIRTCIKPADLIARLGGDEFAVIQTAVNSTDDAVEFVTRIHEAIRRPYKCLGHQLSTDASIGIALAPQDGTEIDQLIKNADLAMYAAKAGGRRTHRFFEQSMDASAKARLSMEQDLRQAMIDGGFEIHYQPVVDLRTGEVSGCEALLRFRHPERGMVSPAEFIPIAEDTGLITELGDWVLRTACQEAASWPDHIRIAVNVSPVQLKCQTLALRIAGALAASSLKPSRLEIEITEAVLIRDDEAALAILHQLRAIGVRIALDDFGTGFSSLSYLKRFPFDKIKIDRCFVSDISETDSSSSIVQAVVNIASALNMRTTAEGVETEAQRELLRKLGCSEMQGYLFSAPKPAAEVKQLFGTPTETVAVA